MPPKSETLAITVRTMRVDGDNLVINETTRLSIKKIRRYGIIAATIGEGTKLEIESLPRIGTGRREITGIKLLPPTHRESSTTTDLSFLDRRESRQSVAA